MKSHIETLNGKLEAPCSEGGENFSVGQRQCMFVCFLKQKGR